MYVLKGRLGIGLTTRAKMSSPEVTMHLTRFCRVQNTILRPCDFFSIILFMFQGGFNWLHELGISRFAI